MINVRLYGHLGKLFGRLHTLSIKTPVEAVRAMQANFPGFRKALQDNRIAGYKIIIDTKDRSTNEALLRPANNEIKIVPIVKGAGNNNGLTQIVLAIVIVVVASYMPELLGAGGGAGGGAAGAEAGAATGATAAGSSAATSNALLSAKTIASLQSAMYSMAASLAMGGISAMLYKAPQNNLQTASEVEQMKGSYFNGPINMSTQGSPVPLAYGKVITGSVIVHAGVTTTEG